MRADADVAFEALTRWADGHDTGIYSYDTLRQLCPCEQCQPARVETTT